MLSSLLVNLVLVAIISLTVPASATDCPTGWVTDPRNNGIEMNKHCSIQDQGDVNETNKCDFDTTKGVFGTSNYYQNQDPPPKQLAMYFYGNGEYDARIEVFFTRGNSIKLTIPKDPNGCFAQDWNRDIINVFIHGR